MGNITIYVPDELEKELKQYELNISQLCQEGLTKGLEEIKKKAFEITTNHKHFGICKILKKDIKCWNCKELFKLNQKAHFKTEKKWIEFWCSECVDKINPWFKIYEWIESNPIEFNDKFKTLEDFINHINALEGFKGCKEKKSQPKP